MASLHRTSAPEAVLQSHQPLKCPGGWRVSFDYTTPFAVQEASVASPTSPVSPIETVPESSSQSGPSRSESEAPENLRQPARAPRPSATPSTCIQTVWVRSRLSTVRYAAQAEVPVTEPRLVVQRPQTRYEESRGPIAGRVYCTLARQAYSGAQPNSVAVAESGGSGCQHHGHAPAQGYPPVVAHGSTPLPFPSSTVGNCSGSTEHAQVVAHGSTPLSSPTTLQQPPVEELLSSAVFAHMDVSEFELTGIDLSQSEFGLASTGMSEFDLTGTGVSEFDLTRHRHERIRADRHRHERIRAGWHRRERHRAGREYVIGDSPGLANKFSFFEMHGQGAEGLEDH
ncbi:hypothetical protein F5Y17DRAFT_416072 [Xylariaceae sp. FL0594]|nr:hypothetical protein F5Y17DRAFT_416072 [Xylariaceae sp. FL0594]